MLTEAEIIEAATAENLTNPDGSAITTEEQLTAARSAAPQETPEEKAQREAEEAAALAAEDPLLKVIQDTLNPKPPQEAVAAPEPDPNRDANLKQLVEWKVVVPGDATDAQIAELVAKGKPADAAPAPAPAPAKKGKKVSVVRKEDVAVIEARQPATAQPPAPAAPIPAATLDDDYIKGLTDEQKEELREAEVAELLEPVKYKDQKKKLVAFYRRFDAETSAILEKEPEAVLEENDQFKALVRTKPQLSPSESKRVNRKIASDETEARVRAEIRPDMEDMKMNQRRIELAPKFEAFANTQFKTGVDELIVADDKSVVKQALDLIKEKGVDSARLEFPLEVAILEEEKSAASRRVEQFLLLKNQAVKYDPANPDQKFVLEFIDRECKHFAENGGKMLVRDGKKFMPRADFIRMLRENKTESDTLVGWHTNGFWSFSDSDIVDFMAKNAQLSIEHRVKMADEKAKSMGFERRPRAKSPASPNGNGKPPVELTPPRATAAPARGPSNRPAPVVESEGVDVIGTMYPHLKKP